MACLHLECLHLDRLVLAPGQSYAFARGDYAVGLVMLTGMCALTVDGTTTGYLGSRAGVFDGRASAIYAPPGLSVGMSAAGIRVEIAIRRCLRLGQVGQVAPRAYPE